MSCDDRPVALVTGTVSPYRREPFRLLAESQGLEVLAWEGAGPPVPGLTVNRTTQRGAVRMAGSGRYRAVIASLGGRVALPGAYAAARRAGIPFVLWATIWEHPRTAAHLLSRIPTQRLYRGADAVITYGRHVSRHVERSRGSRGNVFVAPQAVDVDYWGAEVPPAAVAAARAEAGGKDAGFLALFVGRLERDKGIAVLAEAWRDAGLGPGARLAVAGAGPLEGTLRTGDERIRLLGRRGPERLRAIYAAADVLVIPSIRTATLTEPWGLVVNEAMLQRTPVIASDSVGAVAGGLVRDGRTGLVFPSGDAPALALRLRALAGAAELREGLGTQARQDASELTPAAWADGVRTALFAIGAGR